jgi:hypothetical protein
MKDVKEGNEVKDLEDWSTGARWSRQLRKKRTSTRTRLLVTLTLAKKGSNNRKALEQKNKNKYLKAESESLSERGFVAVVTPTPSMRRPVDVNSVLLFP